MTVTDHAIDAAAYSMTKVYETDGAATITTTSDGTFPLPNYPGSFSGTSITIDPSFKISSTSSWNPLTSEEQEEVTALEKEHERLVKKARLDRFKQIPARLRQLVIDEILLDRAGKELRELDIKPCDRLRELRDSRLYAPGLDNYNIHLPRRTLYLQGVDDEEMIAAHLEACAEESLVGVKDE